MRVMFSLTGLAVLMAVAYAAGSAGWNAIANAGANVSKAVHAAAPSGKASAPAAKPEPEQSPTRESQEAAQDRVAGPHQEADSAEPDAAAPTTPVGDVPDVANLLRGGRVPVVSTQPAGGGELERAKAELKTALKAQGYRNMPDGVSQLRLSPDGTFESIVSKGTSVVPRSLGIRGQRIALSRAGLQARAAVARYMSEHVSYKITDNNRVEFRVSSKGQAATTETAAETFNTAETTVLTSEAILRGAVALYQEIVSESGGQVAIVVVGISSKTLAASLALQGRLVTEPRESGAAAPTPLPVGEGILSGARGDDKDAQEMGF